MRTLATSLLGVTLLAATGVPTAATAADLTVFGDSYSVPIRDGAPTWVTQLRRRGAVGPVHDFAKSGATAADIRTNDFATQLRRWRAAHRPLGDVVVYLGFNDVGGNLDKARDGYQAGIDELVAAGATRRGNRLVLVLPHDVGSVPAYGRNKARRAAYRAQTRRLGSMIRAIARRAGADVVDLLPVFDRVVDRPRAYGLTNVTTADRPRSRTTALYEDAFHFGERGEAIVADAIRPALRGRGR